MPELFIVLKDIARMIVGGTAQNLAAGDAIALAPGETHELSNTSSNSLVFLVAGWEKSSAT